MKSYELVAKTIRGENPGQTPLYGWLTANLTRQLTEAYGSVENFEDEYRFDAAHIFGGPWPYDGDAIEEIRRSEGEVTPEALLDLPLRPTDNMEEYEGVKKALDFYRTDRERFCYMQTNGIFECLNGVFGIQDHLCYLMMYPDELAEVYRRQAEWNCKVAENLISLGVDMIHVSDDWGGQHSMLFSPKLWWELIYPNHKRIVDAVKKAGKFVSLHSDGNIDAVLDGVVDLGYNLVHPYQESAGMSYQRYLQNYADKFALMGGICVQTTLGFGNYEFLESEIRRVFSLLKGRRWVCCTSHFVQDHCSLEELKFAFDLARKLADEPV